MEFIRAQIFGFGKWIDETIRFNSHPFICLYGKNEAGKSTLQQFFLYMLFGMPPRERNRYKPKQSNKIGGTLTVQFPEVGEVTIERIDGDFRLYFPDGKITEDEVELARLLKELPQDSFMAIYAFSSLDLFELHQIKREQLSDLLFSVSVTGSSAVYNTERKIERQLNRLFKRTGRKPLLNKKLKEVSQLEQKLHKLQQEQSSYRDKVEQKEQLTTQLEETQKAIISTKEKLTFHEKLLQFTPQIRSFFKKETERTQLLEKDLTFPEKGVERFEQIKQQLVPIQAEKKSLLERVNEYDRLLKERKDRQLLREEEEQFKQLLHQLEASEQKATKLKELDEEKLQLQSQLETLLAKLSLDDFEASSLQVPFHAKTTWQQLIDERGQLENEWARLQEEQLVISRKLSNLEKKYEQKRKNTLPKEKIEQIEKNVQERERRLEKASSYETILTWEQGRKQRTERWSIFSFILIIVFLGLSIVEKTFAYYLASSLFFILFFTQLLENKKVKKKIASLSKQIEDNAKYNINLEQLQNELRLHKERFDELLAIEQSLKEVQIERLQLEEKIEHLQLKEQNWEQKVAQERDLYPFLKQIDVLYWVELFYELEKVQKLDQSISRINEAKEQLEVEITAFKQNKADFFTELRKNKGQIKSTSLHELKNEQLTLHEQMKEYERIRKETIARLQTVEESIALLESERDKLFSYAKVETEEQFYEKARLLEQKHQLELTYTDLQTQLHTIFPNEKVDKLYNLTLDEVQLEEEINRLKHLLVEKEEEAVELHEQIATVQSEIDALESSDQFSQIVHRYNVAKDELERQAEKWATLKVAATLLQEAKVSFQRKYLMKVMDFTSKYFQFLTEENYTKVFPPTETTSFQVEAQNKIRYTVEELSKGTIDQLYVALRFAISKVMSERFVVPLLIDDAFVHFDEERTFRALQLVEQIAKEQQILLLTCRRSIKTMLAERNVTHRIIEL